jgi:AcrR family transcriptional regulator
MTIVATSSPSPSTSRKARVSDDERRTQVIDAAERVFLEKGFHAATMDDIARQAGMSKKTLYQLFAAKAGLFEALLTDRCSIFTVTIEDDNRPPRAVLTDVLRRSVAHALTERQVAIVRLMVAESPRAPEITAALERLGVGRGKGALETWLAAKAAEGALKVSDPQEMASLLFWTAAGDYLMHALLNDRPAAVTADAIEKRVDLVVGMFFRDMEG